MTNQKELAAMLVHLSDWCVAHRLGSGIFHDTPDGAEEVEDSIFINGNLARVLVCTYELTGETSYLEEAVSWCDAFVAAANPIRTSKGRDAFWWWDVGQNNLYLADTGTAVHALFKAFPHVDQKRQRNYQDALEKFHLLVTEGTDRDPMDRGQEPSPGWVIRDGEDAGAMGVGYRKGQLETRPYTISTACAGAQASAALYWLNGDEACRKTALDAAYWLLGQFDESGMIPYRIEGTVLEEYFFQGIHYSLEGLLTSWLYLNSEAYGEALKAAAPRIKDFILNAQNESGYWGTERAYDGQRSAFMAHFLNWYLENVETDPQVEAGLARFVAYVLNPENASRYGVTSLLRVSGFVGLIFASLIHSELDIRHVEVQLPLFDFSMDELRSIARKWMGEAGT